MLSDYICVMDVFSVRLYFSYLHIALCFLFDKRLGLGTMVSLLNCDLCVMDLRHGNGLSACRGKAVYIHLILSDPPMVGVSCIRIPFFIALCLFLCLINHSHVIIWFLKLVKRIAYPFCFFA